MLLILVRVTVALLLGGGDMAPVVGDIGNEDGSDDGVLAAPEELRPRRLYLRTKSVELREVKTPTMSSDSTVSLVVSPADLDLDKPDLSDGSLGRDLMMADGESMRWLSASHPARVNLLGEDIPSTTFLRPVGVFHFSMLCTICLLPT